MESNDYVSYPLAVKLKEAGFNEPCDHYYCEFDGGKDICFWGITPPQSQNNIRHQFENKTIADAPTLYHAQKWLREVKGIAINVIAHDGGEYHWSEVYLPNFKECGYSWYEYHEHPLVATYEVALSDGLNKMCDLLLRKEVEK